MRRLAFGRVVRLLVEKLGKRVAAGEVKEEFKEKLCRGYAQLVGGKWPTRGAEFVSFSTTSG